MAYTGKGLVKYAEAQLGKPYWYGTFGQIASAALYAEKRAQYPSQCDKWAKATFTSQYGLKVHDCAGLVKGYFMTPDAETQPNAPAVYNPKYDYSANGMIAQCKEQGPYSSMPDIAGLVVWKNNHMGIYTGSGKVVIEAKGHAYGVVKTTDTKWEKWGKLPWLTYDAEPAPVPLPDACVATLPILRRGDKQNEVSLVQLLLRNRGYTDQNGKELAIDKSFGPKTEYAVRAFQRGHGIAETGAVDAATWRLLHSIAYA